MNKQEILQIAKKDPRFAQAILTVENQMGDTDIAPEQLAELVKMLEFALNNPNQYSKIRDAIVKDGLAPAEDLPEQFNPVVLISVLVMLYGLQERSTNKMARGGLAAAARQMRPLRMRYRQSWCELHRDLPSQWQLGVWYLADQRDRPSSYVMN